MRYFISFLIFALWSIISQAQSNTKCSVLDLELDTLICEVDTVLIERYFYTCNGHFDYAISYKPNNTEFLWLMYKYDKKNKIKKVSFWTFNWTKGGGFSSGSRLAVMKIRDENYRLFLKKGFSMSMDYAKLISKCYSNKDSL
jgi:hypothetical protein